MSCIVVYNMIFTQTVNHISGEIVGVLASSGVVVRRFKPWKGQTKDYNIGICCFSAKHAAKRRKSTEWSTQNQWGNTSIRGLLFQWTSSIKKPTKCVGLVQSEPQHLTEYNLFSPWYSWKIAELALSNNHSLTHYTNSQFFLLAHIQSNPHKKSINRT